MSIDNLFSQREEVLSLGDDADKVIDDIEEVDESS